MYIVMAAKQIPRVFAGLFRRLLVAPNSPQTLPMTAELQLARKLR